MIDALIERMWRKTAENLEESMKKHIEPIVRLRRSWQECIDEKLRRDGEQFRRVYEEDDASWMYTIERADAFTYGSAVADYTLYVQIEKKSKLSQDTVKFFNVNLGTYFESKPREDQPFGKRFYDETFPELIKLVIESYEEAKTAGKGDATASAELRREWLANVKFKQAYRTAEGCKDPAQRRELWGYAQSAWNEYYLAVREVPECQRGVFEKLDWSGFPGEQVTSMPYGGI